MRFEDITPEKGMKVWAGRNTGAGIEPHELTLDRPWGWGANVTSWVGISEKPGFLSGSFEYVLNPKDTIWLEKPHDF